MTNAMREIWRNSTYLRLFSAQVVALLGTGLLTVALGLLAFDIAGGDAGIVLGTALTIKMVAYVAVAPVIAALTVNVPRKTLLILADLLRASIALSLPFVNEAWQIYLLVFLLQSASATFTPAFQAVIPEVLPDERQYTRALSLSRLAYDLESLISPVLAAALLTVTSYHNLFLGTCLGFIGSTTLVLSARFPIMKPSSTTPFFNRLTSGVRVFWRTSYLRSLLAMNLVVAASTAMVLVNTVVLVQNGLHRSQSDVALLLAAYGAGSMIVALMLPKVLDVMPDRTVMLTGAACLPIGLLTGALLISWAENDPQQNSWWICLLVLWGILGVATSMILTPSARLLQRAADDTNRPAVFAAQFSLSHACFIVTYPAAGFLGAQFGLSLTALVLGVIGLIAAITGFSIWRKPTLQPHEAAI